MKRQRKARIETAGPSANGSTDDANKNFLSEKTVISVCTGYHENMMSVDETRPITWWQLYGRPMAAYLAASVAAGVVVGLVAVPFMSETTIPSALAGGLVFGLMITPYIAIFAFLPSMAALAAVHVLNLRRGIADTIAGGIIGASLITVIHQPGAGGLRLDGDDLIVAGRYGLAGLIGGYVYWRTNGRPRTQIRRPMPAPSKDQT